jgi:hypothetical protein
VESEFGQGSTFALALPHDARIARRQVSEDDRLQPAPPVPPPDSPTGDDSPTVEIGAADDPPPKA